MELRRNSGRGVNGPTLHSSQNHSHNTIRDSVFIGHRPISHFTDAALFPVCHLFHNFRLVSSQGDCIQVGPNDCSGTLNTRGSFCFQVQCTLRWLHRIWGLGMQRQYQLRALLQSFTPCTPFSRRFSSPAIDVRAKAGHNLSGNDIRVCRERAHLDCFCVRGDRRVLF